MHHCTRIDYIRVERSGCRRVKPASVFLSRPRRDTVFSSAAVILCLSLFQMLNIRSYTSLSARPPVTAFSHRTSPYPSFNHIPITMIIELHCFAFIVYINIGHVITVLVACFFVRLRLAQDLTLSFLIPLAAHEPMKIRTDAFR